MSVRVYGSPKIVHAAREVSPAGITAYTSDPSQKAAAWIHRRVDTLVHATVDGTCC